MMTVKMTVDGSVIDLRSDHLMAILKYALEQAETSDINVLDFGDNENALDNVDQILWLKQSLRTVQSLIDTAGGNHDLLVVSPNEVSSAEYYRKYFTADNGRE